MTDSTTGKSALVIGASKGLGLALVAEHLDRDWLVTATVRGTARTGLHDLAESSDGRLTVEEVDIAVPEQVTALRERIGDRKFDLLFVNAAITRGNLPIGEVTTESFTEVMITNALSPMRVVEAFQDVVPPTGTIGIMSSRQGSVSLNVTGGHEVYRASKSALNQLMRSFAARHADDPRTLLLMCPGWVRTGLGGPDALLSIDESIPAVVDTIEKQAGRGGLHYLDRDGKPLTW